MSRHALHPSAIVALALLLVAGCPLAPTFQSPTGEPSSQFTSLAWPVGRPLHEGLYVMNYVDHGQGDGPHDYACGTRTFEGHAGVDLALTDFRAMDEGTPVYAAAPGTVRVAADTEFDRNMETPYVGGLNNVNQVQVRHADGTAAWYAHLRQHSVAVQVGEQVERGQVLGMIGSSGWSPVPHLHFELWNGVAFGSSVLDPFGTPCESPPRRWVSAPPYAGRDAINVYDADVTLDLRLEGSFGNVNGIRSLKERLDRPATIAGSEPRVGVWLFHQSPAGGAYQVRLLRPDGSLFIERTGATRAGPFGWEVLGLPFAVGAADAGVWRLVVSTSRRTIERAFAVGTVTSYGPRFPPPHGRSLAIGDAPIRETLTLREGFTDVSLRLADADAGVRLEGSVVVVEPLPTRSRNTRFAVVAADRLGRADTMFYHLVDRRLAPNPPFWRP